MVCTALMVQDLMGAMEGVTADQVVVFAVALALAIIMAAVAMVINL